MDINILTQQIEGCTAKLKDLRENEGIFQKAKGLEEEAEKIKFEISELEVDLETVKESLAELKADKVISLKSTIEGIKGKMIGVLPYGEPVFQLDDGIFIGWQVNGDIKPYDGLSGGEKVIFDGAMCHALEANVLIYELAETDKKKMAELLDKLAESDPQIICNTCHEPESIGKSWDVVSL